MCRPPSPPPLFRQFRLPSLLPRRSCLGFRSRLCNGSLLLRRSSLSSRLQCPRRRKTRGSQITREAQLLSEFLLPDKSGRRFGNLVRDRGLLTFFKSTGSLSSRILPFSPLPFRNKEPDRPHQMLGGNVDIPFPEDLGDPISVAPEASRVTSQQSSLSSSPASAPLRRVQAQIRHKRCPLARSGSGRIDTSCAFLTGP